MNSVIDIYYLVFLGFAIHIAWLLGKKEGISRTLDYLRASKEIDFDDDCTDD